MNPKEDLIQILVTVFIPATSEAYVDQSSLQVLSEVSKQTFEPVLAQATAVA